MGVAYPEGEIASAFLCNKLENTAMSLLGVTFSIGYAAVDELEQHGIGDVQGGQLVEGRGREKDLATMVCGITFRTGHHGDRVASIVLVKATRTTATGHHGALVHAGIFFVVAIWAILSRCVSTWAR